MMTRRTAFDARLDKKLAVEESESLGLVADSMDIRMELVRQMNAGEKTLAQVQAELAEIKRNAKKNGKVTRSQVWRQA